MSEQAFNRATDAATCDGCPLQQMSPEEWQGCVRSEVGPAEVLGRVQDEANDLKTPQYDDYGEERTPAYRLAAALNALHDETIVLYDETEYELALFGGSSTNPEVLVLSRTNYDPLATEGVQEQPEQAFTVPAKRILACIRRNVAGACVSQAGDAPEASGNPLGDMLNMDMSDGVAVIEILARHGTVEEVRAKLRALLEILMESGHTDIIQACSRPDFTLGPEANEGHMRDMLLQLSPYLAAKFQQ